MIVRSFQTKYIVENLVENVDKKQLLSKSLGDIMQQKLSAIADLVSLHGQAAQQDKADGSPVTALDLALSSLVEEVALQDLGSHYTFYSEENYGAWRFPLMALDPLDGTREFLAGRPEWVISIGLFQTEKFEGEGWIYNPITGEIFCGQNSGGFQEKSIYQGEVSRSEWSKGLFANNLNSKFQLSPMGSIAYKLGRLSAGKIDFVISKQPKNIWDIAGGTILCQQAGLSFYSEGKRVTKVQRSYAPPLIWCHESLFSELSQIFS